MPQMQAEIHAKQTAASTMPALQAADNHFGGSGQWWQAMVTLNWDDAVNPTNNVRFFQFVLFYFPFRELIDI